MAIDVAVISTTAPTIMRVPDPVEAYGLNVKHKKYDASFVGTPWFFNAMIWESGGLNEEGTMALKQLFKFAAKRSGNRLCVYSAIAWRRVSCALQSSVAQCILNRISKYSSEIKWWCVRLIATVLVATFSISLVYFIKFPIPLKLTGAY